MGITMRYIFFLHMAKTGGLSMKKVLEDRFGKDNCCDIVPLFTNWNENRKKKVFYGHAYYSLTKLLPKPLYTFTILREPIARTVSQWKNFIRYEQNGQMKKCLLNMSISEGLKIPDKNFYNVQTRTLGFDCPYDKIFEDVKSGRKTFQESNQNIFKKFGQKCNKETLERAKKALNEIQFCFMENLEDTPSEIFRSLKITGLIPSINYAPRDQKLKLSKQDMDALHEANRYDLELYHYAIKLFQERLK